MIEIADKIGAPIIKALLGKAVIPDERSLSLGGLGLLGTTPAQTASEKCDAIFFVGTSFPYLEFLPKPDQAKGVQIDDQADKIGLRFPVEVGLIGDARSTLAALSQFIETKEDKGFLENAQSEMQDWWKLMETRAMRDEVPIKPQRAA